MKILFKNPDGSTSVIIPSPNWKGTIEDLAEKDVPENSWYIIVDDAVIPTERTFRNAWDVDWDKSTVVVDMLKARNIWKERIRAVRKTKLEALDIEYQRADENNNLDEKQRVSARKKLLRGLPQDPRFDTAQSVEDLKEIWSAELD